jgi:hypothetical protein
MKQDPRTIINTDEDHTFNPPADKKVKVRTLAKKHILQWVPDKLDTRDYKYQITTRTSPNSIDLRNYCSPIENQGNLGSCTGQAIAGAIGATVTVANARLYGLIQTNIPFSPFTDGTAATDMATLIFTDSAWQNMGGYWNLT